MMPTPSRQEPRRRPPTAVELHRRWLELVQTDGPFLAVPALKRVWPQGMPRLDPDLRTRLSDAKRAFERAWEHWDVRRDDEGTVAAYRQARDVWVGTVLADLVEWDDGWSTDLGRLRDGTPTASSPDHRVRVAASGGLLDGDRAACLVLVVDPIDSLHDVAVDGWAASPVDRMEALLRSSGVEVGLVTDGRWWGLVCARRGAMVASGVVDAQTWVEERDISDAFLTLIRPQYLLGGRSADRLPRLFEESVAAAEEITEALGVQVRRAVELLVTALSEAAAQARSGHRPDPLPADRGRVYEAAVTVMMRVVFLLFAEERGLLPSGLLFRAGYGISGELDALDTRSRDGGMEALDATHLTWHRLLATSNALHAGATFEDLRLPSYGGSLFDPHRFGFLLATDDRGRLQLTVTDRVLREVLHAVQVAELRGQPARRISFRDVDVEQIGYIYEQLLGHTSTEVDKVTVGLIGSPGAEPEMTLAQLEALANRFHDPGRLAEAILAEVKVSQPGAKPPTRAALAKAYAGGPEIEDAERALLAVTRNEELRARLRPLIGVIRRDLRLRPVVVEPGGLVVVETPSRATAGAHYTPRSLAEEVVEHALEPLVYSPGPHQTPDRSQWRRLSSNELLDLKVADIACGSGAFLVAAARYLAARVMEAWREERAVAEEPHELAVGALRKVVAKCLYGADINAMAIEMCKLSLWLVSLDPKLPFSFVDDKVLHGNSLLGLTDTRQLRALHIDLEKVRLQESLFDLDVDASLRRASRLRQQLASEVDDLDPERSAATKRRLLTDAQRATADLAVAADGVVAAGLALGGKPGRALDRAYENLRIAVGEAYPVESERKPALLDGIIDRGLTPTVPTDYDRWKPLHWVLAVPDVMERGGFDAIIGNPPFLGGKRITGAIGTELRTWLVNSLAGGNRGSADIVAYFFLRAVLLIGTNGTLGLIATNSVAQGDTREVGLASMVSRGFTITRSIRSARWPSASANLEYAAVWGTEGPLPVDVHRSADGVSVASISALLEPGGRLNWHPARLSENRGGAFIGCVALGSGFIIDQELAQSWLDSNSVLQRVLHPYLNGSDVNSRPDCSASRWAIDFYNVGQIEAGAFEPAFSHITSTVRPERCKNAKKTYRDRWWQFAENCPGMRKAIAPLTECLVIAQTSRALMPVRVRTDQVLTVMLCIFATDSYSDQAILSSSLHQNWAIKFGSGMRNDPRYTPTDVFETYPKPRSTEWMRQIGLRLDTERREIMVRRNVGLTKLYNLINDPDVSDADEDVARMRAIHVELDQAVMDAYGWTDMPLDHGFHTYRQMRRWTVSQPARVEILDRLLAENHRRAAEQQVLPPLAEADDEEVAS